MAMASINPTSIQTYQQMRAGVPNIGLTAQSHSINLTESLNKGLQVRGVTLQNEVSGSMGANQVIKVLNQLAENEARAQKELQGILASAREGKIPTRNNDTQQRPMAKSSNHAQKEQAIRVAPQAISALQNVEIRIVSETTLQQEYGENYAKSEGLYDDNNNTIIINADKLSGNKSKLALTLIEEALHAKQDRVAEQTAIKAGKNPKAQIITHRDTEIEIAKQLKTYSEYYKKIGDIYLPTELVISEDPNKADGVHTRINSDIRDRNDDLRTHHDLPYNENLTNKLNGSLKSEKLSLQVQTVLPIKIVRQNIDEAIRTINQQSANNNLQGVTIVLTSWANSANPNDKSYFNENTRNLYINAEDTNAKYNPVVIIDAFSKISSVPETIVPTTKTETVDLTERLDGGLKDLGVTLTGKRGQSEKNTQIIDSLNKLYQNKEANNNWSQMGSRVAELHISLDGWQVEKRGERSAPHSHYDGGYEHRLSLNYNFGINDDDKSFGEFKDLKLAILNADDAPFTNRQAGRVRRPVMDHLAMQGSPFASKTEYEYVIELVREFPHSYEAAKEAIATHKKNDLDILENERQRVLILVGNENYGFEINRVFDELQADIDTQAASSLRGGYYQRALASLEINWDDSNKHRKRTENENKLPRTIDGKIPRIETDGSLPYTYSTLLGETKQYYAYVESEWKPIEKSTHGYQLSEEGTGLYSRSSTVPWLMATERSRNLQLDPAETDSITVQQDYINWHGAGDNGYSRLREIKDELKQELIDKYSVYPEDKKKEILSQLRNSGGINLHATLQDRHGVHNQYLYSINVDPAPVEGESDTLDNYLRRGAEQFYNTFRNYVENKEGEGAVLIDFLALKVTSPKINSRVPLSNNMIDALGIVDGNGGRLDPASQAGKIKQTEIVGIILKEASKNGGDLTRSPTFVNAAYKLAEQIPVFATMTEEQKQEAAAEAGKTINNWIKQQRIDAVTEAQNQLKDSPVTPDVLFLQELADAMGVSQKSLPELASQKNWDGKSAFEHFSSEDALYHFLNTLVPDTQFRRGAIGGGATGSSNGTFVPNSLRQGFTKQTIIDKLYNGLEVVDKEKKDHFLASLDQAFSANRRDSSAQDYDSLPEFMRDPPSYFTKKREELAIEATQKFTFLEAKKRAIESGTEGGVNAKYEAFKQAFLNTPAGSVPELSQLGLSLENKSEIEAEGRKFHQQLIDASDKDDFKALSTNTQRLLSSIANILETFFPIIGPLIAAPLYAAAGNWTSFGVSLASGLTDILSLGAGKIAGTIGRSVSKFIQATGGTVEAATKAGAAATKAAAKALNISSQAIGYGAEAVEFGLGIDALLNAKTPEERRQAILGLITASAMSAPTPLIYSAKKLNKLRQETPDSDIRVPSSPNKPETTVTDKIRNIMNHGLSGDPILAAQALNKRTNVVAQNGRQSGDTNGVAVSLLSNPENKLLFTTTHDDTSGHRILEYYQKMGISKDQIAIVNVVKLGDPELGSQLSDIGNVINLNVQKAGNSELPSPNQVYQFLTASGSGAREVKKNFQSNLVNYIEVEKQLKELNVNNPTDIGQSTRLIADKINKGGPAATKTFFSDNWKAYENSPVLSAHQRKAIDNEVNKTYNAIKERLSNENFEGVSLVWSRGLNDSEYQSVKGLGDILKNRNKNKPISDTLIQENKTHKNLEKYKKNPHHLMTPQLFNTISAVNSHKNVLTIPIGDPIEFSPYTNALKGNQRSFLLETNGDDPLNLIQYWKKSGAVQGRYEQGIFLQQLFKKLNLDETPLQQIGLRSGEIEKGAYMGIPTMYLEENLSTSGARLQTITAGGQPSADIDIKVIEQAKKLAPLRAEIDSKNNILTSKESNLNVKEALLSRITKQDKILKEIAKIKNEIQTLTTELNTLNADLKSQTDPLIQDQLDAFLKSQTHWTATQGGQDEGGGLPYFMRENLENTVGLHAAQTPEDLRKLDNWLADKFTGEQDAELPKIEGDVLKGTMNSLEIDMLGEYIDSVKLGYRDYKEKYLPSLNR